MSDGAVVFLPWVREGIAGEIGAADVHGAQLTNAATVPVSFEVSGVPAATVALRPYGPGDVTGIDANQIVRVEPPDGTNAFEPNYFAAIEFARPDLPWLFTPAAADAGTGDPNAAGRLRPWLVLVVVADQEGVIVTPSTGSTPAVLTIQAPALPAAELPDLSQSWAWAHTQVLGSAPDDALNSAPYLTVSRLLAPRHLLPKCRYHACLVPAFLAGRQAALGETVDGPDAALRPAWDTSQAPDSTGVRLPLYFHWQFSTDIAGDFRSLARKLRPGHLPDGSGTRPLAVPSLTGGSGSTVPLEGALSATGSTRAALPDANWPNALLPMLNTASDTVAPPRYGAWYVDEPLANGQHSATDPAAVPAPGGTPVWLGELNLDPRERSAAGLGERVVARIAEQLVASAWAQAGQLRSAREIHHRAQLAAVAGQRIVDRHLAGLQTQALLAVTEPAHTQLQPSPAPSPPATSPPATPPQLGRAATAAAAQPTFAATLAATGYPTMLVAAPFRRLTRPGSAIGQALTPAQTSRAGVLSSLAQTLGLMASGVGQISDPAAIVKVADVGLGTATPDAVVRAPARPNWQPSPPGDMVAAGTGGQDNPAASRFRAAAQACQQRLASATSPTNGGSPTVAPSAAGASTLVGTRTQLMRVLDAPASVGRRLAATVSLPDGGAPSVTAPAPVARPQIARAVWSDLRDLSPELLLPGGTGIPPETVAVARTNPRFAEAFMVGLNDATNRLLLWRGLPIDHRAMPFQQFWRAGDGSAAELPPIDTWPVGSHLGEHLVEGGSAAASGQLVLVLRGELFRRHPGATIYARRAVWVNGKRQLAGTAQTPDATNPDATNPDGDNPSDNSYPRLHARLAGDVALVGLFADPSSGVVLDETTARGGDDPSGDAGWFFVFQEHPGEPRFGLAAETTDGAFATAPSTWQDVAWSDLVTDQQQLDELRYIDVAQLRPDTSKIASAAGAVWGRNGADMARVTLRRPYRVAMHARLLVSPPAAQPLAPARAASGADGSTPQ